jgi:hypothetical protein
MVRERSQAAVRAAGAKGKVRKNPPVTHVPMSADTPEPGVGKKLFSYTEERRSSKSESTPPPMKFTPEHRDQERLLPRLREATRR